MNRFKSHFSMVELTSLFHSFIGFAAADAIVNAFVSGSVELDKAALLALAGALVRSLLKAILVTFISKG